MGFVDGIKGAGCLARVALMLIVAGAFFNWVAFTTTNWGIIKDTTAKADDTLVGIWRRCQLKALNCYSLDGYAKGWFFWLQLTSTVAFAFSNLSLVLILFFVFWEGCMRHRELGRVAAFTCLTSSLFWLFVVFWFGYKFYKDDDVSGGVLDNIFLGFSHTLAIFALLTQAIAGVLMLIEALHSPTFGKPKAGVHFQASAATSKV